MTRHLAPLALLLATACSAQIEGGVVPPQPPTTVTPAPAERTPAQTTIAPAPVTAAEPPAPAPAPTPDPIPTPAPAAPPPAPITHPNVPAPEGPSNNPYDCDPFAKMTPATCVVGYTCQLKSYCERTTRGAEGTCEPPPIYASGTCEMLPCGGGAQWIGRPNVAAQGLGCAPGLACIGIDHEVVATSGAGGGTRGTTVCLRICRVDADCPGGRACITDGQGCDSSGIGHCEPGVATTTTCSTWYAH